MPPSAFWNSCPVQEGACQIGSAQVGVSEYRVAQVRSFQMRKWQVSMRQLCFAEIGLPQVNVIHLCSVPNARRLWRSPRD